MGRRQVGRTPGGRCAHNLTGHAQYVLKGLSKILASSILTVYRGIGVYNMQYTYI